MSSVQSDTRHKILQSASDLLKNGTPSDVRMADVAKAAGISRQALYLHFPNRADLLIATVRYLDQLNNVDKGLAPSRAAGSGIERLDLFIEAWGNYIPKIYGNARALMAMKDTDAAAAATWEDRQQAIRHGCEAAIKALKSDGTLSPEHSAKQATDILWMLVSIQNWEHLTKQCGWSQKRYLETTTQMAKTLLVAEQKG